MPQWPEREEGRVEAHVSCTVETRGRLSDCEIIRVAPETSRFGVRVLRSLRDARLREGRASPGDTYTFRLWACMRPERGPREPCRPLNIPFPENSADE